jgi:hypothetical protein
MCQEHVQELPVVCVEEVTWLEKKVISGRDHIHDFMTIYTSKNFFGSMGFELRASHLLGRCSTT